MKEFFCKLVYYLSFKTVCFNKCDKKKKCRAKKK